MHFFGKIQYFTINLLEYFVSFDDGTSGYISNNYIDGVEIVFV